MRKGKEIPCQGCGDLQYRRPHRVKQIEAGQRQCWCKPCWMDHMKIWSKGRIDFTRSSREENWT